MDKNWMWIIWFSSMIYLIKASCSSHAPSLLFPFIPRPNIINFPTPHLGSLIYTLDDSILLYTFHHHHYACLPFRPYLH